MLEANDVIAQLTNLRVRALTFREVTKNNVTEIRDGNYCKAKILAKGLSEKVALNGTNIKYESIEDRWKRDPAYHQNQIREEGFALIDIRA